MKIYKRWALCSVVAILSATAFVDGTPLLGAGVPGTSNNTPAPDNRAGSRSANLPRLAGAAETALEPCTAASFNQRVVFSHPSDFSIFADTAAGDLTGDGNQDLLIGPLGSSLFGILAGDGNGVFSLTSIRDPRTPGGDLVVVHDMNLDGRLDAVIGNTEFVTYLNSPSGLRYSEGILSYTQFPPAAMIPGDVDSDGIPDLVIVFRDRGVFRIAKGKKNGDYANVYDWPETQNFAPSRDLVDLQDVNGDGKLDFLSAGSRLFLGDSADWSLSTLLGNGRGGFVPLGIPLALEANPQLLNIGDFNEDGRLDALIAFRKDSRVVLFLGNGDGSFQPTPSMSLDLGFIADASGLGDFNLDNKLDVVFVGGDRLESVVLLGGGAGRLTQQKGPDFGIEATAPVRLVVGDFNSDGRPDFAVLTAQKDEDKYLTRVWMQLASCPLSVTVDAPQEVTAGKTLRYDITVKNLSPSRTLESIHVVDWLPADLTFRGASAPRGSCTAFSPVHCDLGSLAPGQAVAARIEATVTPGATEAITNVVTVSAMNEPRPAEVWTTTRVAHGADLALSIRTSSNPVTSGSNFAYLLTIANVGTATATGASLIDTLPNEVSFISAAGCTHSGAVLGGTVSCPLGDIPEGSSVERTITAATSAEGAVLLSNSAIVSAAGSVDPYLANNERTISTSVSLPGPQPVNASFESGFVAPWTPFGNVTTQVASGSGRLGDRSLRIVGHGGVSTVVHGLMPGQMYLIVAWARSTQAAEAYLAADDSSGKGRVQDGPRLAGDSWFRMNLFFQATTSRAVRIFLGSEDAAGHRYWDDVQIRPVQRRLIKVPEETAAIQGAIDQSQEGDVIEVAAGTYVESINFKGKGVHVKAEAGPGATILKPSRPGWVVSFTSGEPPLAVLEGFTVREGEGGVLIESSSPTIRRNVIAENRGPGVSATGSFGLLAGNTIRKNQASRGAGVLAVAGAITLRENLIVENCACDSSVSSGGGVYVVSDGLAPSRIERNIIQNNQAQDEGGGMFLGGAAIASQNIIRGNTSINDGGGGVKAVSGSRGSLAIVGNLIVQNTGLAVGGMILSSSGGGGQTPRVAQNTIADNSGVAILHDASVPSFEFVNNIIVAAQEQTAVSWHAGVLPVFHSNNVFSPSGPEYHLLPDMTGMDGNISANPLFVNAAGGDYRLGSGSPSIDAGRELPDLPFLDVYGQPRRVDGDRDGSVILDMGALEHQLLRSNRRRTRSGSRQ